MSKKESLEARNSKIGGPNQSTWFKIKGQRVHWKNLFCESEFQGLKPGVRFPKHDRPVAFTFTYRLNFSPHQICSTHASSQHVVLLKSECFLPLFCRHICHSSLEKCSQTYLEVSLANVLNVLQSNCFETAINHYICCLLFL